MKGTLLLILVIFICLCIYFLNGRSKMMNGTQPEEEGSTNLSTMLLWEEDYLMAEIISSKNIEYAKEKLNQSSPNTSLNKVKTVELGIPKTELINLLKSSKLPQYERLSYVGVGESKILENPKTMAFGSFKSAILFDGDSELIENIWLASYNWAEINQTNISKGLIAIGEKYNMILIDHFPIQNKIVELKDEISIRNYLNVYIKMESEK